MQSGQEVAHLVSTMTLTAKPSSHHVHVTLWVTLPTSPCPTLSADTEPASVSMQTVFSAQSDVIKSKGFLKAAFAEKY